MSRSVGLLLGLDQLLVHAFGTWAVSGLGSKPVHERSMVLGTIGLSGPHHAPVLKAVFGGKNKVSMFEMTKLVSNHLK